MLPSLMPLDTQKIPHQALKEQLLISLTLNSSPASSSSPYRLSAPIMVRDAPLRVVYPKSFATTSRLAVCVCSASYTLRALSIASKESQ